MNAPLHFTPKTTIADRLKEAREHAGLSQSYVAIDSGTTSLHIIDLENGCEDFEGKAVAIARALSCNPVWLETGFGEGPGKSRTMHQENASNQTPNAQNLVRILDEMGKAMEQVDQETRKKLRTAMYQLTMRPKDRKTVLEMAAKIITPQSSPSN